MANNNGVAQKERLLRLKSDFLRMALMKSLMSDPAIEAPCAIFGIQVHIYFFLASLVCPTRSTSSTTVAAHLKVDDDDESNGRQGVARHFGFRVQILAPRMSPIKTVIFHFAQRRTSWAEFIVYAKRKPTAAAGWLVINSNPSSGCSADSNCIISRGELEKRKNRELSLSLNPLISLSSSSCEEFLQ